MHRGLEKSLAFLIFFFSATELGRHFWPTSALVYGIRVDYLSPTLYFLDLLIVMYLFVKLKLEHSLKIKNWYLKSVVPLLLVNLLFSTNPLATISWSLHLLLYAAFVFFLSSYTLSAIPHILIVAMFFQVALGGAQVALGHSFQGIFYWLGERAIAVGAPSIATASFFGRTILRAYGTFSHPNVLAGWLVVACLIVVTRLIPTRKPTSSLTMWFSKTSIFVSLALATIGVILTESRTAALALFGGVVPLYYLRSRLARLTYFVFLFTTALTLLSSGALTRSLDLSILDRLRLQEVSFAVLSKNPLFGSGANASITAATPLTKQLGIVGLQPDHDSFTLFLSWFGIFGALAFVFSLKSKIINHKSLLLSVPLFPLLLLDHYLLTSPQGLFILLLYFRTGWHTDKLTSRFAD